MVIRGLILSVLASGARSPCAASGAGAPAGRTGSTAPRGLGRAGWHPTRHGKQQSSHSEFVLPLENFLGIGNVQLAEEMKR